ncbi:MAG: dihydropteroate synthase, partial [Deltaproteobacteria bacterium]|nr:dihydropteroate synthase [Deltaproteobacteria bacterium]
MGTGDAGGRVPDRAAGGDVAYDWSRRDIPNRASHSDAEDERETRRRQDPFPLLLDRAFQMIAEGADILDIGGESSRPGATPVETDEELRRVIPVIEVIRQQSDIPISIDTTKARVALEAVSAGASMINDISA